MPTYTSEREERAVMETAEAERVETAEVLEENLQPQEKLSPSSINFLKRLVKKRPERAAVAHKYLSGKKDRCIDSWLRPWTRMQGLADRWQEKALFSIVTRADNTILNCSRGAGKSEVVSLSAYLEAAVFGGLAVAFSRSDRQAKEEVFDRVVYYHRLHGLVPEEKPPTTHELRLANGGRVLSLPCSEATVVGKHQVSLLIIDEAAKVPDLFYARVAPMISIPRRGLDGSVAGAGRLVILSTPFGKRGFFYREWTGETGNQWRRYSATWKDCQRITLETVETYRRSHGDRMAEQEYGWNCDQCKFQATQGAFFDVDLMQSLVSDDVVAPDWW